MEALLVALGIAFVVFLINLARRHGDQKDRSNALDLSSEFRELTSTEPDLKPAVEAEPRRKHVPKKTGLDALPPVFVVLDLETTGLDASRHEIIEIGAIHTSSFSFRRVEWQAC